MTHRGTTVPRDTQRHNLDCLSGGAALKPLFSPTPLFTLRISPSCATVHTSSPWRLYSRPKAKPLPPDAAGDSISYNSHSSARNSWWNRVVAVQVDPFESKL
jgi:hypothetical protein